MKVKVALSRAVWQYPRILFVIAAFVLSLQTAWGCQVKEPNPLPEATLPPPTGLEPKPPVPVAAHELGKELSTVAGVSVKRHLGNESWSCGSSGDIEYRGRAIELGQFLESVSALPTTRIKGLDILPGGTFDIRALGEYGGKDVHLMIYEAIGRRCKLRIGTKKVEADVLVLSTNRRWAKQGFKHFQGKIPEPPTLKQDGGAFSFPLIPFSRIGGGPNSEADGSGYWSSDFENVTMDVLAKWLEQESGHIVVNETKLQGRFDGEFSFTYRDQEMLAKLGRSLARHGLSLTRATRSIEKLLIEPLLE